METNVLGRIVYYGSGYLLSLAGAVALISGIVRFFSAVQNPSSEVILGILGLTSLCAGIVILKNGPYADRAAVAYDVRQDTND